MEWWKESQKWNNERGEAGWEGGSMWTRDKSLESGTLEVEKRCIRSSGTAHSELIGGAKQWM